MDFNPSVNREINSQGQALNRQLSGGKVTVTGASGELRLKKFNWMNPKDWWRNHKYSSTEVKQAAIANTMKVVSENIGSLNRQTRETLTMQIVIPLVSRASAPFPASFKGISQAVLEQFVNLQTVIARQYCSIFPNQIYNLVGTNLDQQRSMPRAILPIIYETVLSREFATQTYTPVVQTMIAETVQEAVRPGQTTFTAEQLSQLFNDILPNAIPEALVLGAHLLDLNNGEPTEEIQHLLEMAIEHDLSNVSKEAQKAFVTLAMASIATSSQPSRLYAASLVLKTHLNENELEAIRPDLLGHAEKNPEYFTSDEAKEAVIQFATKTLDGTPESIQLFTWALNLADSVLTQADRDQDGNRVRQLKEEVVDPLLDRADKLFGSGEDSRLDPSSNLSRMIVAFETQYRWIQIRAVKQILEHMNVGELEADDIDGILGLFAWSMEVSHPEIALDALKLAEHTFSILDDMRAPIAAFQKIGDKVIGPLLRNIRKVDPSVAYRWFLEQVKNVPNANPLWSNVCIMELIDCHPQPTPETRSALGDIVGRLEGSIKTTVINYLR